jgi:hypothetical protein
MKAKAIQDLGSTQTNCLISVKAIKIHERMRTQAIVPFPRWEETCPTDDHSFVSNVVYIKLIIQERAHMVLLSISRKDEEEQIQPS